MPSQIYKRFTALSILLLMLCPFVFSHAGYLSRPLLRFSLIIIPIFITGTVFFLGPKLKNISSGERILIILVSLNVLWEFLSCFWAISYSTGIRELGASIVLLQIIIAISTLRRSVDEVYFKRSLIAATTIVLLLVFAHTLFDLWTFTNTTLAKYNVGLNSRTVYALKTCFYHKNSVSAFVLLSLAIMYTASLHFSKREKLIIASVVTICLLLILFFQSRSVQLALLLFTVAALLLEIYQSQKTNLQKFVLPVALVLLLIFLIAGTGRLRYSSWNSRSSQERVQLWQNSVDLIKEKPLVGHGIGNWPMVFPKTGLKNFVRIQEKQRNFFLQPHCDYLKVWSETGLIGLLLYLSIPFYLLYRCIQRKRDKEAIFFFALFTFYFFSLVTGRKGELHLYVLLGALLVDAFGSTSETETSYKEKPRGLTQLLFAFFLPLAVYSLHSSHLEHRQINNTKALVEIGKNYDRVAFDENLTNNFHPLAATTRMTAPVKARFALALVKIGYQEDALQLYEEAFEDSPFHLATKFRAAKLYISCNQEERAKVLLQEILKYNPTYKPAIDLLGSIDPVK